MRLLSVVLLLLVVTAEARGQQGRFAPFVEPSFPFFTTTVDARHLAPELPARNVAVRGVVVQLGDGLYAAFDPDLLRMAVGWHGSQPAAQGAARQGPMLSMTTMAQISYDDPGNKANDVPRVLGRPVFGTGVYPGWSEGPPRFVDPRPAGPNPDEVGRGPLPAGMGRWEGLYVSGDRVELAYSVGGTPIREQPSARRAGDDAAIARTFRVGPSEAPLSLVAAEGGAAAPVETRDGRVFLYDDATRDTVTAVALVGAPDGAELAVMDGRHAVVTLAPRAEEAVFSVVYWRGRADRPVAFERLRAFSPEMADLDAGGPERWPETVTTSAAIGPDTAALAVDEIALPLDNPWDRNVRVADVDFFDDGRAVVVTFDGDVWRVSGLHGDLAEVEWKRIASGLYETMNVSVVDGEIYVYGREGIVRLHDLDGDEEADFYESFSSGGIQSVESREFPLSMVEKPGGGFYLAKGAALNNGPPTSPQVMPGFRRGAPHSGAVLEVSPDGERVEVVATGLREPFLGIHPETGLLTASDQQGNFVPTTPIHVIREGGYYGVPATAHRTPVPEPTPPLTWVPHEVDPSGAEQVWALDGMGPLENSMVHLSYGRPTAYHVVVDSLGRAPQGGVTVLPVRFPGPVLRGQAHPGSGRLYLTGFQVWGTQAREVSGFYRLRATGRPLVLPTALRPGREGLLVRFSGELDPATAAEPTRYAVRRWNYRRTERYGSGHFTMTGEAGQEAVPVLGAQLSDDRRAVLLTLPDMREVMQMAVAYRLRAGDGTPVVDTLYLTVNALQELHLDADGFEPVSIPETAAMPYRIVPATDGEVPTADAGARLFRELGCVACHSVDGTAAGKVGPSLLGLPGKTRRFHDGTAVEADADYIRESILAPSSRIVEGYEEGMPVYRGVLSDAQVEALILFIQSLTP